jgi:hypothetical protein
MNETANILGASELLQKPHCSMHELHYAEHASVTLSARYFTHPKSGVGGIVETGWAQTWAQQKTARSVAGCEKRCKRCTVS